MITSFDLARLSVTVFDHFDSVETFVDINLDGRRVSLSESFPVEFIASDDGQSSFTLLGACAPAVAFQAAKLKFVLA